MLPSPGSAISAQARALDTLTLGGEVGHSGKASLSEKGSDAELSWALWGLGSLSLAPLCLGLSLGNSKPQRTCHVTGVASQRRL